MSFGPCFGLPGERSDPETCPLQSREGWSGGRPCVRVAQWWQAFLALSRDLLLLFHSVSLWAHFFLPFWLFLFSYGWCKLKDAWSWETGRSQVRGALAVTQVATSTGTRYSLSPLSTVSCICGSWSCPRDRPAFGRDKTPGPILHSEEKGFCPLPSSIPGPFTP